MTAPEPPFPCPFCQSPRVTLVGGGLVFLHYRCGACAEVWTAMVRLHATDHRALRRDFAGAPAQHGGQLQWSDDGLERPACRSTNDSEPGDADDWRSPDDGRETAGSGARRQKIWRH